VKTKKAAPGTNQEQPVNLNVTNFAENLPFVKPARLDRLERFRVKVCADLARLVLEIRELRSSRKAGHR
jgi:hypothetical protein